MKKHISLLILLILCLVLSPTLIVCATPEIAADYLANEHDGVTRRLYTVS